MIQLVMYSSLLIFVLIILVREGVEAWRQHRFDRDQRIFEAERRRDIAERKSESPQ